MSQMCGEAQLILERAARSDAEALLRIVPKDDSVLGDWTGSTRASTLFRLSSAGRDASPESCSFDGEGWVFLVGPTNPENVLAQVGEDDLVWASLGLLNTLVFTRSDLSREALEVWATKGRLAWEAWHVSDGRLLATTSGLPSRDEALALEPYADFASSGGAHELREAVREFCGLWAVALTRSDSLPDDAYAEMVEMADIHLQVCADWVDTLDQFDALGEVITENSALSRMTTQLLAGTSPVLERECGLAMESVLGVGVAVLALGNLRRFLQSTLNDALLAQRLEALGTSGDDDDPTPILLAQEPPTTSFELMDVDPIVEVGDDPDIPRIPHFSGREGYRSTETAISVPLAAISSCNSIKWSLLTLTHEILHGLVDEFQAVLLPLDDETLERLFKMVDLSSEPEDWETAGNLLDEIRRTFIVSYAGIIGTALQRSADYEFANADVLRDEIIEWRPQVDEVLVHVLDFLYFYGRDPDLYVRGIWASWGVIPDAESRVRDYVVRTACAVMSIHLRRNTDAVDTALTIVEAALERLQLSAANGPHVDAALRDLRANRGAIEQELIDRYHIVLMARHFMWSEQVATAFSYDPSKGKGGYAHTVKDLDFEPDVANPLEFIEAFSRAPRPDALSSAWMLYVLAFGLLPRDEGGV